MNNSDKTINIQVDSGDATSYYVDVLVLKYAQSSYGLDLEIARRLTGLGFDVSGLMPRPGQFEIISSKGTTLAPKLLFVGVNTLSEFGYKEIRQFSRQALIAIREVAPEAKHIGVTLHGVNYGLDETESFEAELAGFLDALHEGAIPSGLELITFIERNESRVKRIKKLLGRMLPHKPSGEAVTLFLKDKSSEYPASLQSVGYGSESKPHIFVAMPFADEMEDIYHYGIRSAVKDAGYICERADQSSFTGDILDWVKRRIQSSTLLIADLTNANPNVYLEVGYAWGCGVPTVFLVRDPEHLKFDVRGQRCLVYKSIKNLEEILKNELAKLG